MVGSIALFLGVMTGWAALSLIPILRGAIALVHLPVAFSFGNPHGGWGFPAFWGIARVAQMRLGNRAFALPVRFARAPGPHPGRVCERS